MTYRTLAIVILLICSSIANAQHKQIAQFTLTGKVTGRDTGIIRLNYLTNDGTWAADTAFLKDGVFTFKGKINSPVKATLAGDVKSRDMDDPNFTELFLTPGNMTLALRENDFKRAKLAGSVMQDDMDALNRQKQLYSVAISNISHAYKQLDAGREAGVDSKIISAKRDSVNKIYLVYRNLEKKIDYTFIASHKSSYLSPYLMIYYFGSRQLSLDSAEIFYDSFSADLKNSEAGKSINNAIVARKSSAIGSMAPVFIKTDIDGKALNLASFRGKNYVILDFWASWCLPCRKTTPYIKELYNKYHAKRLDVISLSWDNDTKAWKDAIAVDSTGNWHHVLANMYLPHDNSLRTLYAIEAIPTFVLIDNKGIIIGRWTGIGEAEETEIEKLLNKELAENN